MAIVRLPRALLKNYLTTIYFSEGKGTPLPFWGPSQSFGFSLFPLPMSGDPRSLRCEHLHDPHSFLTVTFWLLDTLIQYGRTASVLPPRLREPSRDNWHDLHAMGSHRTDSQQEILCCGFKGVQEEIPREEASTLQIRSVAFPPGQCTSPQPQPCHRLFDQDGYQDSSSTSL